MTAWTKEELGKIGAAEELDLASRRGDGTLRAAVTMWVVRVDDELFVRAYKGRRGPWFRGVLRRHEGRIQAGGVDKAVSFVEEKDPGINDRIDATYRSKYGHYDRQYVDPMVTPAAREATIKLVPRSENS
jgi:hypothetical protein